MTSHRPSRALGVLLALHVSATAGAAQENGAGHPAPSDNTSLWLYATADSAYYDGRPEEAWHALVDHLEGHPDDYEALWRAARSALVIAVDTEGNRAQNAWLDPGRELAERAVELRPVGIEGLYMRSALAGRRAMNATPGRAVELAQAAYDDASHVLELDSLHGGAHNVLGKINYEIMSLSRIQRFVARLVMGNEALRQAGWEEAEEHLARATELWPEVVVFQYDLAALYEKRGRDDEARVVLERTIDMPLLHPPDARYREQAAALLEKVGG